ncbi:RimJ/RimL family protein N-acetyltransferase [Crossiella equi]|uniref:RimJ/RimL family protein N-acetyltransferase n=1 Tax=Crossiella equi TaxID=130796 RepID=A0ABS5AFN9_9PSEU|nr:GNAT family protein [Crossiella equi]MBP2475152.1 RimJ/RimL family protein N-acetyltransferase [Crossiella equi]
MLRGANVVLRPYTKADAAAMYEVFQDPEAHMLSSTLPWYPIPPDAAQARFEEMRHDWDKPLAKNVPFAIELDGELAGSCSLWGIDYHHRNGEIGITVRPEHRGKGVSTDAVRVLCQYAFRNLGLHRVRLVTGVRNVPMQRAALAAGFTEEGRHREAWWEGDGFSDDVHYGLLVHEWRARQAATS